MQHNSRLCLSECHIQHVLGSRPDQVGIHRRSRVTYMRDWQVSTFFTSLQRATSIETKPRTLLCYHNDSCANSRLFSKNACPTGPPIDAALRSRCLISVPSVSAGMYQSGALDIMPLHLTTLTHKERDDSPFLCCTLHGARRFLCPHQPASLRMARP
jgi:hypothetical protein